MNLPIRRAIRSTKILITAGILLMAGCADTRPFHPVDAQVRPLPNGPRAAVYEITSSQGNWGNIVINVWTEGAIKIPPPKQSKKGEPAVWMVRMKWQINNNA